jgi:hypothetical protein
MPLPLPFPFQAGARSFNNKRRNQKRDSKPSGCQLSDVCFFLMHMASLVVSLGVPMPSLSRYQDAPIRWKLSQLGGAEAA